MIIYFNCFVCGKEVTECRELRKGESVVINEKIKLLEDVDSYINLIINSLKDNLNASDKTTKK